MRNGFLSFLHKSVYDYLFCNGNYSQFIYVLSD